MAKADAVNLVTGKIPDDYHCRCAHCERWIGELRPAGGGYYSRLERREYYDAIETTKKKKGEEEQKGKAHIAKTPLHVARWLVQSYTDPGQWVLDPTIGAGTTAVEALTQGRNVAGMEVQFADALSANIKKNRPDGLQAKIRIGDARRIGSFLDELGVEFDLVVNNPPYSGDKSDGGIGKDNRLKGQYAYEPGLPNLAFLNEGPAYWEALGGIYDACVAHLKVGGYFAFGVKDMMRAKKPFMLHQQLNTLLDGRGGLRHVGTAVLKHHPATLFLNTYEKFYGVKPPLYQTISVFEKGNA